MTTVPSVADGQLIATSWGNTVATVVNGEVVRKDGATMTGMLVLPGTNPTTANQATRKGYVDAQITNSVTNRVSVSGDTMTGALILPSGNPTGDREAAHRGFVMDQITTRVAVAGDTLTGVIAYGAGVADPTGPNALTRRSWQLATFVNKTGDTMSGALNMGNNHLTNLPDPIGPTQAATMGWCNAQFAPAAALDAALARIAELEARLGD